MTVSGPADMQSASVDKSSTLWSMGPSASIGCVGTCNGAGAYSPGPSHISSVTDPLAGLAIPIISNHLTQSGTTLNPGIYSTISAGGSTMLTLNSGLYVITGSFSTSGNGGITTAVGGGILLYFACSNYPTPCKNGGVPATMDATGNNGVKVTPSSSGPYAGIAIFFDPDSVPALAQFGKGGTLTVGGTFYARSAPITMKGGNGTAEVDGRLIVGSLTMENSASGWIKPIGGGVKTCTVWDDDVSGTSGSTTSKGHVVAEAACQGGTGIIDFNYGS
jgi:hypothetical protein